MRFLINTFINKILNIGMTEDRGNSRRRIGGRKEVSSNGGGRRKERGKQEWR